MIEGVLQGRLSRHAALGLLARSPSLAGRLVEVTGDLRGPTSLARPDALGFLLAGLVANGRKDDVVAPSSAPGTPGARLHP